jgi:hypothetical protein
MKYEIVDKVDYTTVQFLIEREDGRECRVRMTEHDWHDSWEVIDENGDVIDNDDPLAEMLIEMCEAEITFGNSSYDHKRR